MKKIILLSGVLLLVSLSYSQNIQKGSLIGLHLIKLELKPGVTTDQFKTFYATKVLPAYEDAFSGVKGYLLEAKRGENQGKMGILWLFPSEADRDKYFSEADMTDAGKAAVAKVADVDKELDKMATTSTTFTDWVVQ